MIGYLARLARVSDGGESVLAYAYDQRPRDLEGRHVVVPGSGRGGGLPMNRVPAVVDLATLSPVEAIQVDGEPVSTATPDAVRKLRQWKRAPVQGDLFAGPKTLDGRACGDVVLQALAECDFRDLRSPLLGDIARVAALAVGLTGYGPIPDDVGAAFVGGAAPAGDTVEIVSVQRGAKGRRPTGLWIRASARYCEAFIRARKREWERLPASHLLRGAS